MALPAAVEPLFLPFHHGVNDPDTVTALFLPMARLARESFALVYFDALGRLVGTRHGPLGNTDSTTLPWRRLAIDTIALDARRVVLAHNHPSGDANPSMADISLTRRLALVLDALEAPLYDHLIVAAEAMFSFRLEGLLQPPARPDEQCGRA